MSKKYRERTLLPDDSHNPSKLTWRLSEIRTGSVQTSSDNIRLSILPTPGDTYSNAQISDYSSKRDFKWEGNLSLTVRAHVEPHIDTIRGTAGFGFWNQPFVPNQKIYDLPQAAWFFFGSPPNNMQLALDVPGSGWKAGTIDAKKRKFLMLLPTAPIGFLLMRFPFFYRRLWPIAQRTIGVSEFLLDSNLLTEPHTYTLKWLSNSVEFYIDGELIHKPSTAPRGPMGFVAWIDNQYAVVTPQGSFRFGLVPVENEQTLVLSELRLSHLFSGDETSNYYDEM